MVRKFAFVNTDASTVINEASDLLEASWKEATDKSQRKSELNLNFDFIRSLDKTGLLRSFAIRCDGDIVGVAVFTFQDYFFNSDYKSATQLIFFIEKNVRALAIGFLRYCDTQLLNEGADFVSHSVRASGQDWSKILLRSGYSMDETIYARRLQ